MSPHNKLTAWKCHVQFHELYHLDSRLSVRTKKWEWFLTHRSFSATAITEEKFNIERNKSLHTDTTVLTSDTGVLNKCLKTSASNDNHNTGEVISAGPVSLLSNLHPFRQENQNYAPPSREAKCVNA